MPTITDIGTLIVRTPGILGGRPRLAGTRVSVQRVVGWYKQGLNAEEIIDRLGNLTPAQVYAALTYYHANPDEIEGYLDAEQADYQRLAAKAGQPPS